MSNSISKKLLKYGFFIASALSACTKEGVTPFEKVNHLKNDSDTAATHTVKINQLTPPIGDPGIPTEPGDVYVDPLDTLPANLPTFHGTYNNAVIFFSDPIMPNARNVQSIFFPPAIDVTKDTSHFYDELQHGDPLIRHPEGVLPCYQAARKNHPFGDTCNQIFFRAGKNTKLDTLKPINGKTAAVSMTYDLWNFTTNAQNPAVATTPDTFYIVNYIHGQPASKTILTSKVKDANWSSQSTYGHHQYGFLGVENDGVCTGPENCTFTTFNKAKSMISTNNPVLNKGVFTLSKNNMN